MTTRPDSCSEHQAQLPMSQALTPLAQISSSLPLRPQSQFRVQSKPGKGCVIACPGCCGCFATMAPAPGTNCQQTSMQSLSICLPCSPGAAAGLQHNSSPRPISASLGHYLQGDRFQSQISPEPSPLKCLALSWSTRRIHNVCSSFKETKTQLITSTGANNHFRSNAARVH